MAEEVVTARITERKKKLLLPLLLILLPRDKERRGRREKEFGGDTSITKEAPKDTTKHYNLRKNARIRCHPYEVNNMLSLTKKFKTLSLEDISISKDFEDMKRSKPMKMGVPSLNP